MILKSREDALNYINAHPETVLDRAPRSVQGKPSYVCPICGNGSGPDGTGITSPDGKHWKCFKCGFYGDVIDLIYKSNNLGTMQEAFELEYGLYDIQLSSEKVERNTGTKEEPKRETQNQAPDFKAYIEAHRGGDTSYLQGRGISPETAKRLQYGYDAEKRAVVIPLSNREYMGYTLRYTDAPENGGKGRYEFPKGSKWGIFNEQALYGTDPVFITEGAIDATSIEEVGGTAVAINSVANADKFLRYLQDNAVTAPYFLIGLDNDTPGKSATQKIMEGLKAQNRPCSAFFIDIDAHDINTALQSEKTALQTKVREALENIDTRNPEQIDLENHKVGALLPMFRQYVEDERNNKPIPTGFSKFDYCIGGGLLPRFYVIGAVTSLGKTTLVLQMIDNIAKAGGDVLFFSLEMAKEDIIARSISRHTYEICTRERLNTGLAKTELGVLMGSRYKDYSQAEKDLIADAYTER